MNSTTSATAGTPEQPAAPDPLAQPATTETTGRNLAKQLNEVGAEAVLCWDVPEDAVLAHVVARELGVPLWRAVDVEGIIELARAIPKDTSVVLVADTLRQPTSLAGLIGIVSHHGGRAVGVATAWPSTVLSGEAPSGVHVVTAEGPQ